MLRRILRIIAVVMILPLFYGCKPDGNQGNAETTTMKDTPTLSEFFDGYTVVVDNNGDFTDVGYKFAEALEEKCGIKIIFQRESAYSDGKAIFIGNTDEWKKTETEFGSLYDYGVISSGENLVINGGSVESAGSALDYFVAMLDSSEWLAKLADKSLSYIHNEEMLPMQKDGVSVYTVVVPSGREWIERGDSLAYKIKQLTGVRPDVVEEGKYDGEGKAVYLGNTDVGKAAGLRPLDYSIGVDNGSIIIAAGTIDSTDKAIERFISELSLNSGEYPFSLVIKNDYSYADGEYEASLITNLSSDTEQITLEPMKTMIFEPEGERYYNHDAYLCISNGTLFAGWSSGYIDENAPGQRIMYSYSTDEGASWSAPQPIADTIMGKNSELVYNFRGFYSNNDRLVAYFSAFEYDISVLRNGFKRPETDKGRGKYTMYYSVYSEKGWSAPCEIPDTDVFRVTGNALSNGRLLFPGHNTFTYTDNANGTEGFIGKTVNLADAVKRGAEVLWEASCFIAHDGMISMMMRSNTNKLWCSVSNDNGDTWSSAYPTAFTDDDAKVQFGNLPDGRACYLGCPVANGKRSPLIFAVSDDGKSFNRQYILGTSTTYRQQKNGIYKNGMFSYPAFLCDGENIFIVYSLYKEAVQFMKVPLGSVK